MRIVLIGQAAFGAKVLEALLEKGEEVAAVYTLPDPPGGRLDPTKETAQAKGIPVVQPATYKDDAVYEQYRQFEPELTVMGFVTPIIPARYFNLPRFGTINYHPSILPRHRGASAINWAVIMGDSVTGLSIFWPDGGIDTGPVLLQKEVPIGPDDTTGSLYFNHLFPMGVNAMVESMELVKQGKAPKLPQDEAKATYEPICDDKVAGIDFGKPAAEVYNLVRGCDPQPGAFALMKGEKVRFYGARLLAESGEGAPGTVAGVGDDGLRVTLDGGVLLVGKVRGATGGKVAAAEFAGDRGVSPGDSFESGSG